MPTKKRIQVTKDNFGELLIEGLTEAKSHAEGKLTLATETLLIPEKPPKFTKSRIKKLRKALNLSQPVFALWLNVTASTVKSWERGENTPAQGICRLLQIIENDPEGFMRQIFNSAKIV